MINYDLKRIKAFIFDVDGVLSANQIPLAPNGDPMRTVNIKDGYAMKGAVNQGYTLGIITGCNTDAVRVRFERLGVQHIYMCSREKIKDYEDFLNKTGIEEKDIVYCGDDIPDYEVMRRVGLSVAPIDAAPEIIGVAKYVSPVRGGYGVGRDVIEQVMRTQGKWMTDDAFGW